jgi:hypothetical protein
LQQTGMHARFSHPDMRCTTPCIGLPTGGGNLDGLNNHNPLQSYSAENQSTQNHYIPPPSNMYDDKTNANTALKAFLWHINDQQHIASIVILVSKLINDKTSNKLAKKRTCSKICRLIKNCKCYEWKCNV